MSESDGWPRLNVAAILFLFLLRVAVGWHFLYEGLYKAGKAWDSYKKQSYAESLRKDKGTDKPDTAAAADADDAGPATAEKSFVKDYLSNATGPFAGTFKAWAADPATVRVLEVQVIAGLILCGGSLLLGLFTRLGCVATMAMLTMFYISAPPWAITQSVHAPDPAPAVAGKDDAPAHGHAAVPPTQQPLAGLPAFAMPGAKTPPKGPSEGNYLVVNKNLIEFLAVGVLLFTNAGFIGGLDILVRLLLRSRLFAAEEKPDGAAPAPGR